MAKESVARNALRAAAKAATQRVRSSFFAPALQACLPEDGCPVIEAWPARCAPPEQPPDEQLRFAGGPVPCGAPVRFAPVGVQEPVVGVSLSLLKWRKCATARLHGPSTLRALTIEAPASRCLEMAMEELIKFVAKE